jgi:hypothetical protein
MSLQCYNIMIISFDIKSGLDRLDDHAGAIAMFSRGPGGHMSRAGWAHTPNFKKIL